MLRPWLFVGFTGHRKLADPNRIAGAIREVLQRLDRTGMPLAAVSSAASGADTLFVRAALDQKLPWTLLLPFPPAAFRQDFSAADWAVTERLLPQAIWTHIEPPAEKDQPAEENRKDAFLECGIRTLDNCDVVVAVWDGQEAHGRGGTGDMVAYARNQKKPLFWIHATTGAIIEENLANLPPAAPPEIPAPVPALDPHEGGLPELQATLEYFDEAAVRHAPAAREFITRMILLHLAATAVALLTPLLGFIAWAAFVLIMLKIVALIYADRLQHRGHQVQDEWLRHRIVAELCRSAVGTWPLRFSDRVHPALMVPGFRDWQRSLRLWRLLRPPKDRNVEAMRFAYAQGRMQDQIKYFTTQLERAENKLRRGRRVAKYSTRAAIACGVLVLALIYGVPHPPVPTFPSDIPEPTQMMKDVLKYFSLVLPLLSASVLHWLVAQDCGRRAARNREMLAFLQRTQERVLKVTTWSGLERLASETETMLLLEILEWHSVSRFTGEAH